MQKFTRTILIAAIATLFTAATPGFAQQSSQPAPVTVRTPATPLVTHDPYFSLWSFNDKLTDGPTRQWTGVPQQMDGFIRIDNKTYRFMGDDRVAPAFPQVSREIWPTRTIYNFEGSGVHLTATFFTPALPHDLDVLSRPLSYLIWTVRSTDGQSHNVQLYFDASANLAVNTDEQPVVWGTSRVGDLTVMQIGTSAQHELDKAGDNLRIDWGWADVAVRQQPGMATATIGWNQRNHDVMTGTLADMDDLNMPRAPRLDMPLMVVRFDLGQVASAPVTRKAMLAYNDRGAAIEFLHRTLPDYWQRNGMTFAQMLEAAEQQEPALYQRSVAFDHKLVSSLTEVGGTKYAQLAVVAYQQALAANKIVASINGTPLLFSKENFSNGCTDTVDVTYPTSPIFLLLNPELLEAELRPVMEYAGLPRWRWPFAPHDLGTYPLANGQVYGGGEHSEQGQMPVEESGNMLIMADALAHIQGNADFAAQYWPLLTRWAAYLRVNGLDPGDQLSTDDFAGPSAHNANLALKAILALGAYSQMAHMLGKNDVAAQYHQIAQHMAHQWMKLAAAGDHTRLAYNLPDSWSQKYNLVWNSILNLDLFPPSLAQSEVKFYIAKHMNPFGVPLDDRATYTKLDWSTWTATMADNQQDWNALIAPLYRYMTETPTRVPLSDWYQTTTGKQVGFQARSVVGGIYIKMLTNPTVWKNWAATPTHP